MKALILLVVLCLLSACTHQARKVDCEAHLTPINPPTPLIKAATTPPTPATIAKPEAP